MKIFITGGTGNISTAITKILQSDKENRLTLFKKTPHRPDWLNEEIRIIAGERSKLAEYKDIIFREGPFDCVIDMICYEQSDAVEAIEIFSGKTKQFIFCSTVDVYEKRPLFYPVTEENGNVNALPSFQYAYKKMLCERSLWNAHNNGSFKLTVLRPAFTYNEGWSPGVHSFGGNTYHLDRIKKGKPIIIHGDGTSIWVATHRNDIALAFANAVGNNDAYGQAYNITGDEWITHNHIWQTIARIMDAPSPDFIYIPTLLLAKIAPAEAEWCRENFMHNNIFDNSKAKKDLGFKYTVSFKNGAQMCIKHLTENDLIEDSDNYLFYDGIVEKWKSVEHELI